MRRTDVSGMTPEPTPSSVIVQSTPLTVDNRQEGGETQTPSQSARRIPRLFSITPVTPAKVAKNGTEAIGAGVAIRQPATQSSTDTETMKVESQQQLLNEWLETMLAREQNVLKKPVIVYKVHPQSGIGNMIRGLLTAMLFSVALKKGVTGCSADSASPVVYSYDNYYCHFFFPPFPNMCNLKRCAPLPRH